MGGGRSGRVIPIGRGVVRAPTAAQKETAPSEERSTDYHEFKDSGIIDEWTFRGDGRDVVNWFNTHSNYDGLINGMDRGDRNAFGAWMRGHWMRGQMYRGFDRLDRSEQDMIRSYDKVLDQSVVNDAFAVRRLATAELVLGAGNKKPTSLAQLQALQGQVIKSTGNMSTAAASRGLGIGSASSKSVEYVMKFPSNTKGAGMWIGDKRIGGWGAKQREFMTNRDIKFRVGKTTYNSRTKKYEVELIYVGRDEHDYGHRGR